MRTCLCRFAVAVGWVLVAWLVPGALTWAASESAPVFPLLVKQVATGRTLSAAVTTDGRLWMWRHLDQTMPEKETLPVEQGTGFASVSVNFDHALAIRTDGSLWAWGQNISGQLGNGSTAEWVDRPVLVGQGFVKASAGGGHSLALKNDGSLWAWGRNEAGPVGNGTTVQALLPVQIGQDFVEVFADDVISMATQADGSLWRWGERYIDRQRVQHTVPQRLIANFGAVRRMTKNLLLKADGSLWTLNLPGTYYETPSLSLVTQVGTGVSDADGTSGGGLLTRQDGSLWAWGSAYYQFRDSPKPISAPVQVGNGFTGVNVRKSGSLAQAFVTKADGTMWRWGTGNAISNGRLIASPFEVARDVKQVSTGFWSALGLTTDGRLLQWGPKSACRIGTPQPANYVEYSDGLCQSDGPSDFVQLAAGSHHLLGLKADGSLWAMGWSPRGELGIGPQPSSLGMFTLVGTDFIKVVANGQQSAGIKADGSLWVWGAVAWTWEDLSLYERFPEQQWYANAQWFDGVSFPTGACAGCFPPRPTMSIAGYADRPMPLGSGFHDISLGLYHGLALKKDGTLWAWGNNRFGILGDGTTEDARLPVQVGAGFTAIAAAVDHNLALKVDGSLWAWGYNGFGQLGTGHQDDVQLPSPTGYKFARINAGRGYSLGEKADGSLWAWGRNVMNRMTAFGGSADTLLPMHIGEGFVSVSAADQGVAAIKTDGRMMIWGVLVESGMLPVPRVVRPPQPVWWEDARAPGQLDGMGQLDALTLQAIMQPLPAHAGQAGHKFLLAVLPDQSVWGYTPGGWRPFDALNPPVWGESAELHFTTLLNGGDARALRGTIFHMGYGLGQTPQASFAEMMASRRYKRAYQID